MLLWPNRSGSGIDIVLLLSCIVVMSWKALLSIEILFLISTDSWDFFLLYTYPLWIVSHLVPCCYWSYRWFVVLLWHIWSGTGTDFALGWGCAELMCCCGHHPSMFSTKDCKMWPMSFKVDSFTISKAFLQLIIQKIKYRLPSQHFWQFLLLF